MKVAIKASRIEIAALDESIQRWQDIFDEKISFRHGCCPCCYASNEREAFLWEYAPMQAPTIAESCWGCAVARGMTQDMYRSTGHYFDCLYGLYNQFKEDRSSRTCRKIIDLLRELRNRCVEISCEESLEMEIAELG